MLSIIRKYTTDQRLGDVQAEPHYPSSQNSESITSPKSGRYGTVADPIKWLQRNEVDVQEEQGRYSKKKMDRGKR